MSQRFRNKTYPFLKAASDEKEYPQDSVEARIIRVSHGEVRPRIDHEVCGICGRTILVGETPELYEAPHVVDEPLVVCSICRPQARDSGLSKVA